MGSNATNFGPTWPTPLVATGTPGSSLYSASPSGTSVGAVAVTFTYTINDLSGYQALGWGQGLPSVALSGWDEILSYNPGASAIYSASTSTESALWTGSIPISGGTVNVELVATIVSGASGWAPDTYAGPNGLQNGAPTEVALIDSGTFVVSLELLAASGSGAYQPFDVWDSQYRIANHLLPGQGDDQINTDGEFAGELDPVSVATFLADKGNLDNTGGFAISDTAADVSANFDALNADNNIEAIYLTDPGTPTLTLSVDEALNDATALGAISGAYDVAISDSSANFIAGAAALAADTQIHITSIAFDDAMTPTLTLDIEQALVAYSKLLSAITTPYNLAISDSSDDFIANFTALDADLAHISAIDFTDANEPTLTLTVDEALDNSALLGKISSPYEVAIADSAANVAANLAALSGDPNIVSIALTDAGTPTLTLTVDEALNNSALLGKISSPYGIAIDDSAANVGANLAALSEDPNIVSIALTDAGTPALTLSVDEALNDSAVLGKISSPYAIAISDSSDDFMANFGALNADVSQIASIVFTDAAEPTLRLSIDEALNDSALLGKISSPYEIAISDSSDDFMANFEALNADVSQIASIGFTDAAEPTLRLSVDEALDGFGFARQDQLAFAIAIEGDATDVGENLEALSEDPNIVSIALTDTGTPTLTLSVDEALNDTTILGDISGAFNIDVSDTASDISGQINALNNDAAIKSITISDNMPLTISIAQGSSDSNVEGELHNANGSAPTFAIADTASNIVASLATLEQHANLLVSITATSGAVKVTVAEFEADQKALDLIVGGFTISDTSAHVSADLSAINKDAGHIHAIDVTGASPPVLTVAAYKADEGYYKDLSGGFKIKDAVANVNAGLAALELDYDNLLSITATGGAVSVSVATLNADFGALDTVVGGFVVSDTAAHLVGGLATLLANAKKIASIKSTSGQVAVSARRIGDDRVALDKISGGFSIRTRGKTSTATTS